jgi:AraC family transcriptional regulator of adaptative response / DNA-3-methyladenine glycosylase II
VALVSGFGSVRRFNAAFTAHYGLSPGALRREGAQRDAPCVVRLGYRPPYDFETLLAFLRTRALPGVEQVDEHSYARVFGPADAPGWLRISAWPGGAHALQLQLHCPQPAQLLGVVTTLRRMFDLDANPQSIADTFRHDAILGPLLARRPGLRLPGGWDGFEIAVRAILGQQISVAAARTLATRIVQRWGEPLPSVPMPGLERLFPTPAALAGADLREIGLTTTRAATISGMAQALLDGRVTFRADQSLDAFVASWTALPGIGEWTAHYIAMRTLGDPDAFPAADLILRREATTDALPLSTKALAERAQAWRPWRAYAVIHLWRAASDALPPPRDRKREKIA